MRQSLFSVLGVLLCLSLPLAAQPIMEITPTVGYTFGGSFDELGLPDSVVESVDVNDNTSYGLIFDIGNENGAFEVTWSHLSSELEGNGGAADGVLLDYSSDNFQFGYVGYFGGDGPETKAFWNASLGFTDLNLADQESDTKFSAALGIGMKHQFNDRIGIRVQARWIPTYINTDDAYVVCDPYFCYTVGDDNYLYQTEVSAGLVIRLGH
ncbi:MAG: hypothetical protein WC538_15645 [Thermoanaerobaculia bacterium]|jgi:hypothetical protein